MECNDWTEKKKRRDGAVKSYNNVKASSKETFLWSLKYITLVLSQLQVIRPFYGHYNVTGSACLTK